MEFAIGLVCGKWKPIILFHIETGAKRYSELQRLIPDASDRMLSRSLREMESDHLISRKVYAEVPARVEYTLTKRSKALYPILASMSHWGTKYMDS